MHLDLSQRELTSFLCGDAFMDGGARRGNSDEGAALQGCYLSADAVWIAATISDADRPKLEAATNGPGAMAVAEWISSMDAADALACLAGLGIPAAPAASATEVFGNRSVGWQRAVAADPGRQVVKGVLFDSGELPASLGRPAGLLGADTREGPGGGCRVRPRRGRRAAGSLRAACGGGRPGRLGMGVRSDLTGPLGNRDFRRLWSSVLVSNIGSMAQNVGAGWMMATIAQSDTLVALVQASTTLPVMLFSLLAGALADSIDRRRQMLAGQSLMFVTSTVLAVATYAGVVTPTFLLSCTFVIGCGTALHIPASQASVSDLVPSRADPVGRRLKQHVVQRDAQRRTGTRRRPRRRSGSGGSLRRQRRQLSPDPCLAAALGQAPHRLRPSA